MSRYTITIAALAANAYLYIFLITIMTVVDKDALKPPLVVLLAGSLLLAGALLATRRRWLLLVVVAFFHFVLTGTVPHDLPAVIHPRQAGKFVFALLALIVPLIGIGAGIGSFAKDQWASDAP